MRQESIQFVSLQEVKTIRFTCKSPMCGTDFYFPFELLKTAFASGACPVCGLPFGVVLEHLLTLFKAVDGLQQAKVGIEFVIPIVEATP